MQSFQWDTNFLTGQDRVDQQHQHLVELINRLGQITSDNQPSQVELKAVLTELREYTRYHFEEEEQLMERFSVDPRHCSKHISTHRAFESDLEQMIRVGEQTHEFSAQILDFLVHWLAYHILGTDKNMVRQVDAINSGTSPAQAYASEEKLNNTSTEPLLLALKGLFRQVSQQNRELLDLNHSLEQKVAERTEALLEANRHLEQLAMSDVMTGLPNRRCALARLAELWSAADDSFNPISCMMIDADHFKAVNDNYGHAAGDRVIQELAQQLKDCLRTDDIVARLGGDEFLIICPKTSHPNALQLAEAISARVNEMKVATGEGAWLGSVSIGVATQTAQMSNYEGLISQADSAVYLAKEAGKNCVRGSLRHGEQTADP